MWRPGKLTVRAFDVMQADGFASQGTFEIPGEFHNVWDVKTDHDLNTVWDRVRGYTLYLTSEMDAFLRGVIVQFETTRNVQKVAEEQRVRAEAAAKQDALRMARLKQELADHPQGDIILRFRNLELD